MVTEPEIVARADTSAHCTGNDSVAVDIDGWICTACGQVWYQQNRPDHWDCGVRGRQG